VRGGVPNRSFRKKKKKRELGKVAGWTASERTRNKKIKLLQKHKKVGLTVSEVDASLEKKKKDRTIAPCTENYEIKGLRPRNLMGKSLCVGKL